jgi:hypothetical protein
LKPSIAELDFAKVLEVASASGRFSREELELLDELREKKDQAAHIEAEPPLLSDQLFTFAEGTDRAKTVQLKILGFDYYEYLLPRVTEYAFALYGEQAISMLETLKPQQLLMKMVALILDRPRRDRLKVSLLETLSYTFSTPAQPLSVGFLYVCPPDELIEACMKLVEINQRNFSRFWGRVPLQLKNQVTLLYLTSIQTIETLNTRLREYISSMTTESLPSLWSSGGVSDTGTAGSNAPASSEKKPARASARSKTKRPLKSG